MAIMEITVNPIGTKTPSISEYVASSEKVLAKTKAKSQITAMGTIVEAASLDELFRIAEKMHKKAFVGGVKRVFTTITIDDRIDKVPTIEGEIASLKKRLMKFPAK